jgi:acetolactate synthase-1/2/3 large subunit
MPYWPELVSAQLEGLEHLILADAAPPVSFFAYADQESSLVPAGCEVHELSTHACDVVMNLEALAEALDAAAVIPAVQQQFVPARPTGPLTAETVSRAIGSVLPEGAIIADESLTSGAALARDSAGGPRHTWLTVAGGALGQGMPAAVGAAIACPERPVIALEGDGATLYSIQSLWTMARERLDVTVIVLNNRAYRMISTEFSRHGKPLGDAVRSVSDLGDPNIDFVAVAAGFGVPSLRAEDAEQLAGSIERAIGEPGPHLIETVIPAV